MRTPNTRLLTEAQCVDLVDRLETEEAVYGSSQERTLMREVYTRQAQIAANGGKAPFPGLFWRKGRYSGLRAPAKLLRCRYTWCWAMLDAKRMLTGTFYRTTPLGEPSPKLTKAGFEMRQEDAPAEACIENRFGRLRVVIRRLDHGCPADALARQPRKSHSVRL